jgi:D-threo-aldose 1-dehydrogenase
MMSDLRRRRLGRTGLTVSEMGLGCYMTTGEFGVSQEEAGAIFDLAFDSGINYVDTAMTYGDGESEELVGRALQRHGGKGIHVSSKVGWLGSTLVRRLGDAAYRDEDSLLRVIKHSLWVLRRDRLDMMMVHEPNWPQWGFDLGTGDAPVVSVLERLKKEGAVGAIGLAGWDCDNIACLIGTGRFDSAIVAGAYSLMRQQIKKAVIPEARRKDVGLIAGGVLLQGRLAMSRSELLESTKEGGKYEKWLWPAGKRKLELIYDLCDQSGMRLPEMGVRYVLGDPDVHAVVVGAQEVRHLRSNLDAAAKGPLPRDVMDRLEEIDKETS